MKTRKAQILMEPDEYKRLERIAKRERKSVSELIRDAVRDRYLGRDEERSKAADAIGAMSLDLDDWEKLKRELEDERARLP